MTCFGDANMTHLGRTNPMSNPLIPQQEDHVNKVKREELGYKLSILQEQKSTAWMKEIIQKSAKPGNPVLDQYVGALSVAKACMHFPKQIKS